MNKKKAFPLRLDESTFNAMQRWSDDELRSLNGQIEYVLREALRNTGRIKKPDQIEALPDTEPE